MQYMPWFSNKAQPLEKLAFEGLEGPRACKECNVSHHMLLALYFWTAALHNFSYRRRGRRIIFDVSNSLLSWRVAV